MAWHCWRHTRSGGNRGEALEDYLDRKVFAGAESRELMAEEAEIHGFERFLSRYRRALAGRTGRVGNLGGMTLCWKN